LLIKDYTLQNDVTATSGWSSKKILLSYVKSGFAPIKDTKGQDASFVISRTGAIETVKKRPDNQSHVISVLREVGTTQQMSAALATMGIKFDYPKPNGLIEYLISMLGGDDFTVIDFFAGSGTTANAIVNCNLRDGGTRKYILVEWDDHIIREICAKRLALVLSQGGLSRDAQYGFRFCELGDPLFDSEGQIGELVTFKDLAHHVFFMATGEPLPDSAELKTPLLGVANGIAVYLLFNGILGDRSVNGGNILTREILASLPPHEGTRIIYGNGCRISPERLRRENIIFRQVPYEVRVP
jgi:hypothetical protein